MGFFKGIKPTIMRATLLGATYMGTYDSAKHGIINSGYFKDGLKCQLTASIISGFAIAVVTTPMDNIKTRIYT